MVFFLFFNFFNGSYIELWEGRCAACHRGFDFARAWLNPCCETVHCCYTGEFAKLLLLLMIQILHYP